MLQALQALVAHNLNQQQAMQRAVQAQAQGLDPAAYGTVYPGSTVTTTHNTTTTNNTGSGILKGALLSTALLTAGTVGGGLGLLHLNSKPAGQEGAVVTPAPVPPPQVREKVITVPGATQDWDAVYEELQPDGTWRQIKRERLTPPAKEPSKP